MNWAWPQHIDCRHVLSRGVAFVVGEAVARVLLIQIPHHSISGHFSEHAGGGNRVAFAIALDQSRLGVGQPFDPQSIDKDMLGPGFQLIQSDIHRSPGGLANIDSIDRLDIDDGDRIADFRVSRNPAIKLLALLDVQLLRIVQRAARRGLRRASWTARQVPEQW